MPNQDGTGPEGKGSKTGRQMGRCQGKESRQCPRGFGKGQGRGFRQRFSEEQKE